MAASSITFTANEAIVLESRLSMLNEEETWEDLFEDVDDVQIDFQQAADYAERMRVQINAGDFVLPLDVPCALEVLAEALEGSTLTDLAKEGIDNGKITPQKRSAIVRARDTAAKKIETLLGRELQFS
ncbi:hypothetical protein [Pseudomonas sp. PLMAX]|uniref:hypothetical protein n=1 Tax=Pseudomonas sp. PLMAX TaxID=2201998 RepID=UPI0038BC0A9A